VERTPVTITSAQRTARPTTGWPSPSALSFREPMHCSDRTPQDKRLYRPLQPPHPPGRRSPERRAVDLAYARGGLPWGGRARPLRG
jgi:hypothetical protein